MLGTFGFTPSPSRVVLPCPGIDPAIPIPPYPPPIWDLQFG